MQKRKILFFLMSAVGGAERMTVTFAKQLDRDKNDVIFYLIDYKKDKRIEDFIPKDYKINHIALPFGLSIKSIHTLYNILKRESPDFVFSSLISINFRLLVLAPIFRRTKFIVRNNIYLKSSSTAQKLMMRFTYNKAVMVIAQTEEMKYELEKSLNLPSQKVVVIHNPVDKDTITEKLKDYKPFMDTTKTNYVAVGRFAKSKGFDVLLEAFNHVLKKEPTSELYIVGRYDDKDEYFRATYNTYITPFNKDKVHFVGFTDNPYRYMKNADCFVLSSRYEGLPNVLIEALHIGTPAAACTCIPVIERIVDEGNTGFLAPSEAPQELSVAMMKASKLGRIKTTYKSSSFDDFLNMLN